MSWVRQKLGRHVAWLGWAVAGVLLLGAGGSAVAASLSNASQPQLGGGYTAPAAGPALGGFAHRFPGRGGGGGRWRDRAPVRGEVTVPGPNNTFQQIAFARGVVTAISESSLSIRSADGTVTTFALNADTKYRRGRQELKRTDVTVNAQAFASGQRSGQTVTAAHVLLQPERRPGGQRRPGTPAPAPTPAPSPGPTTTT